MKRDRDGFRRFFQTVEQTGLKVPLRLVAAAHGTTLADVYGDSKDAGAVAARIESWWRLIASWARSGAEVARLYDRERSSVYHAIRRLHEEAGAAGVRVTDDTVRALARIVAAP